MQKIVKVQRNARFPPFVSVRAVIYVPYYGRVLLGACKPFQESENLPYCFVGYRTRWRITPCRPATSVAESMRAAPCRRTSRADAEGPSGPPRAGRHYMGIQLVSEYDTAFAFVTTLMKLVFSAAFFGVAEIAAARGADHVEAGRLSIRSRRSAPWSSQRRTPCPC